MRANVPKCVGIAMKASTTKAYNPNLTFSGQPIPYLDDTTFRFLGAPVAVHSTSDETREHLITKLASMLEKVDATSITRQQKLKLFKVSSYLPSPDLGPLHLRSASLLVAEPPPAHCHQVPEKVE